MHIFLAVGDLPVFSRAQLSKVFGGSEMMQVSLCGLNGDPGDRLRYNIAEKLHLHPTRRCLTDLNVHKDNRTRCGGHGRDQEVVDAD